MLADIEACGRTGMAAGKSVVPLRDIMDGTIRRTVGMRGLYALWWTGDRQQLLSGSRMMELKVGAELIPLELQDWWGPETPFPCLFVGRATNIDRRLRQHVLPGKSQRVATTSRAGVASKRPTSTCQLRWGLEHVFPGASEPLKLLLDNIGVSWQSTSTIRNPEAWLTFEEGRLVNELKPWFNVTFGV